jgi:sulfatase maturation enzyme AslB (radical SAM superfamily)
MGLRAEGGQVVSFQAMVNEFMDYPFEVSLETQALCNAACTFCPYPTIERKGTKMSDALIDKVIDEIVSWNRFLFFSPFKLNEPLLDPRTIPLCERINERAPQIRIRLFTNGSALIGSKIDAIAKLKNVEHLWISLNEYRPEEYEKLMGLRFEITAKRIDDLHSRDDFPHEVVLSCVGGPNEAFRWYCYKRWPKFKSFAIKKDAWLGYTEAQIKEVPDTPCARWLELSIMATGETAHCCMHDGADKTYNIGDINTQSLYEIYNSPRWRERRDPLVSRKTLDESSPCARCTY